ncbi:hypothetical protein LY78DRAFT_159609 [Colletotrichum sublineola]|nr:hypothetical protein LY78DRAFT_159609 [Colletotrichum sublineola]
MRHTAPILCHVLRPLGIAGNDDGISCYLPPHSMLGTMRERWPGALTDRLTSTMAHRRPQPNCTACRKWGFLGAAYGRRVVCPVDTQEQNDLQPHPPALLTIVPDIRGLMDATDAAFGPLSPINMTRLLAPSPSVLTRLQQSIVTVTTFLWLDRNKQQNQTMGKERN